MDAVPGIGPVTAQKLVAEFYDLASYSSAKAVGADAGVTPANYESGSSVRRRPRLSKIGKASIRAALYMPAITVMSRNTEFKAFAARLAARALRSTKGARSSGSCDVISVMLLLFHPNSRVRVCLTLIRHARLQDNKFSLAPQSGFACCTAGVVGGA